MEQTPSTFSSPWISHWRGPLLAALGLALLATSMMGAESGWFGRVLEKLGWRGLSREEVETFDFSRTYIGSKVYWRIKRTSRENLVLLRQRAKFVLQNDPDAQAEVNAQIVIRITDRMGLGDPPDPPDPPEPPVPPDPPDPPNPPDPPPDPGQVLIVPGDPDNSILVQSVEGNRTPQMPLYRPLPPQTQAQFRVWVAQGAWKSGYVTGLKAVMDKHCTFCHKGATAAADIRLDSWASLARHIGAR